MFVCIVSHKSAEADTLVVRMDIARPRSRSIEDDPDTYYLRGPLTSGLTHACWCLAARRRRCLARASWSAHSPGRYCERKAQAAGTRGQTEAWGFSPRKQR